MDKFLRFPVGSKTDDLRATDVVFVKQESTNAVSVSYLDGSVVVITHAAAPANDTSFRKAVQDLIISANSRSWNSPLIEVDSAQIPFAISDIIITVSEVAP